MPLIKLNATQGLTGTLPAVSGANLTGISAGKIVQVKQESLSTQASTTSTSFVSTGLDIDFTPSSSSNKVLVSFMLNNYAISSNTQTRVTIYRDSTNLGHSTYGLLEGYTNVHHGYPLGMLFLDTPNTSSQIHYEIYVSTNSGTLHYGGNGSYAMTDYIQCFEVEA